MRSLLVLLRSPRLLLLELFSDLIVDILNNSKIYTYTHECLCPLPNFEVEDKITHFLSCRRSLQH